MEMAPSDKRRRERWSERDGGDGRRGDTGARRLLRFCVGACRSAARIATRRTPGEAARRCESARVRRRDARGRCCSVETRTKRAAERSLALFDRLPALLERREIPAAAVVADDPQSSLVGVEREPTADRKVLDTLIRAELLGDRTGTSNTSRRR